MRVHAEVAEIVVHRARSGPRAEKAGFHDPSGPRRAPILVTMVRSGGIWVQGFPDDRVGDMGAVEVAGVDMIDTARRRPRAAPRRPLRHGLSAVRTRPGRRAAWRRSRSAFTVAISQRIGSGRWRYRSCLRTPFEGAIRSDREPRRRRETAQADPLRISRRPWPRCSSRRNGLVRTSIPASRRQSSSAGPA